MVEKEHYRGGKKFFAFYTEKELKNMLEKLGSRSRRSSSKGRGTCG